MTVAEIKPKAREDVVELLEDLLQDAKRGELHGVIIAGTGPASVYTASAGRTQLYESLGAMLVCCVDQIIKNDQQVRERIAAIATGEESP